MNIKHYMLLSVGVVALCATLTLNAATQTIEPIQACTVASETKLSQPVRHHIARCLHWQPMRNAQCKLFLPCLGRGSTQGGCYGKYAPLEVPKVRDPDTLELQADDVSLQASGRSTLKGHVTLRQTERVVNADTAYVHRDPKTNKITKIELLGNVRYMEDDKLMYARYVTMNPETKAGHVDDVLYRFDQVKQTKGTKVLPAWGRAKSVHRFENQNILMQKTTYSTCPPRDRAWQLEASKIVLDHDEEKGIARDAVIRVKDIPVVYAPYLTFPTSKKRKSGFLMPAYGYSNIGGFDVSAPYYWNMAPNYDAVIIPHLYTMRGVMIGGDFRYLTHTSEGVITAHVLPQDRAQANFIAENEAAYPVLSDLSKDRWSVLVHNKSKANDNVEMGINFQAVSDDYYLQDFSTNLSILTENQLLQEGHVSYTSDHWFLKGLIQAYQTLHPITQSDIFNSYERIPEVLANADYDHVLGIGHFSLLAQFDYFNWPSTMTPSPEGPRSHISPVFSVPLVKPWGYIEPKVQLVQNNYHLTYDDDTPSQDVNRTIPRYSVDGKLIFERDFQWGKQPLTQTLEPRLYYLYVPYRNQSIIPAFDSAYMIFTTLELFRNNRFSGYDRISDTNQLSYALTGRWLSSRTGEEFVNFTVGQIRYFSDREVQLCYSVDGECQDNDTMLGFISPVAPTSPIASSLSIQLGKTLKATANYVWNTATRATNNADVNIHFQPEENKLIRFGYGYLFNANIIELSSVGQQDSALNQATGAFGWPLSERWSALGVYSYNLSKGYGMIAYFGLQYDTCCWALRLLGGQTFQKINASTARPDYNNNGYIQVLLKGLGSVGNSDPASVIKSYLPGYPNIF